MQILRSKDKNCEIALNILSKVFHNSDSENHFLSSIDDRYWCHYIGTSIYRALKIIPNNINSLNNKNPKKISNILIIQVIFLLKIQKINYYFH